MRIDFRNDKNAPACRVVNRETGGHLLFCVLADEENGEVEQYIVRPDSTVSGGYRFILKGCPVKRLVTRKRKVCCSIELLVSGELYRTGGLEEPALENDGEAMSS